MKTFILIDKAVSVPSLNALLMDRNEEVTMNTSNKNVDVTNSIQNFI